MRKWLRLPRARTDNHTCSPFPEEPHGIHGILRLMEDHFASQLRNGKPKTHKLHDETGKCATTIALHVSLGTFKRAPDTCGLLSPSHEPNIVTSKCQSQSRSFKYSNTSRGSQPQKMSPTEDNRPGTMKKTSFEFPGVTNCGPDFEAEGNRNWCSRGSTSREVCQQMLHSVQHVS